MAPVNVAPGDVTGLLGQALWPLIRISAFIMTCPVIGTRAVPARVKLILTLAITAVLVPVLPPAPDVAMLSATGLLVTAQQVIIGVALGLALRLVFMVLELAGQLIAMQMGLGFASMVDPANGSQVPVIAQFYVTIATLLFLATNGHLALIDALADSFRLAPIAADGPGREAAALVLDWAGWLLGQAVLVSLPAVVALTIVNIAFGIMTRAAPQMNIFAVGFPITLLLGVGVMLVTLPAFEEQLADLYAGSFGLARAFLGGP